MLDARGIRSFSEVEGLLDQDRDLLDQAESNRKCFAEGATTGSTVKAAAEFEEPTVGTLEVYNFNSCQAKTASIEES